MRAFGRDAHGRREVVESTEGVRVATMRTLRVAFLSALSMDLIAGFGVGLVAMALGLRLLWGELDLQTAMAVLLVTPEIFVPLRRAGAEFHASTEGQAAAARVARDTGARTPTIPPARRARTGSVEPAAPRGTAGATSASMASASPMTIALRCRPGGLLAPCATGQPAGARRALRSRQVVGRWPRCSGSSTARAGSMSVDGTRSSECSVAQWRTHFSWLPQRPYLFTATLAENLRLGAPEATDEELRQVIAAVGLDRLVPISPRAWRRRSGRTA